MALSKPKRMKMEKENEDGDKENVRMKLVQAITDAVNASGSTQPLITGFVDGAANASTSTNVGTYLTRWFQQVYRNRLLKNSHADSCIGRMASHFRLSENCVQEEGFYQMMKCFYCYVLDIAPSTSYVMIGNKGCHCGCLQERHYEYIINDDFAYDVNSIYAILREHSMERFMNTIRPHFEFCKSYWRRHCSSFSSDKIFCNTCFYHLYLLERPRIIKQCFV